jgi:hypothetical protein
MQSHRGARGHRSAIFDTRKATAAIVTAIAALGAAPAADAAVRDGRVIEIAHSRDLVILDGYPSHEEILVEVLRGGVAIASTDEQRYKTDGTGFLEINHTGDGDCFNRGGAPDIRPGDTVQTTVVDTGEVDSMVVQHVTHDGQPIERTVERVIPAELDPVTGEVIVPERTVTEGTGVYEVTGLAMTPEGAALSDQVEVRLNHPDRDAEWAASGRRDWRVTASAKADGSYVAEFDTNGSDDAQFVADAALSVLWLGSLSELTSYDDPGSPCPPAATSAITRMSHTVVNRGVDGLTLSGPRQDGVSVAVNYGGEVTETEGGWSATIPAANLDEGNNRVTVTFSGPGAPSFDSRPVWKDTVAPAAPTANLASGAYDLPQTIHLGGEGDLHYTTDGSEPTAASPRYTAGISVTSPLTIMAVAIDEAGNMGPAATFAYTQKPAPVVVPKPEPKPVVVEKSVETVREVVREVAAPVEIAALPVIEAAAPAPALVPAAAPVKAPAIDRVLAPKSVKLRQARKGVTIMVTTAAVSIRATASTGGKVTARFQRGVGYKLTFKAARRGTYRITITPGGGASKVISLRVR